MEIGFKYNLDLVEDVSDILSNDFWVFNHLTGVMIPKVNDPLKFSSSCSVFVRKGSADIEVDLITYHVVAPAIVNIRQSQIFQFSRVSKDFDSSFIVLSKRFRDNLFLLMQDCLAYNIAGRNVTVQIPEQLLPKFERFYSHISEIFAERKDNNSYQVLVFAMASFFYECGIKCYENLISGLPKTQTRLADKFISLVQENFKKERFLDFYSKQLEVTPKHLSRAVKNLTGFTATEWIDRYCILESKVLLKSTNLSIQQISDMLNFPSQSFFGKYFKKHTGMSPKEFRNN